MAGLYLLVVDEAGDELSRHRLAVSADAVDANAAAAPELPATLDWYRDAARWWATAAAAFLVFGVGYLPQEDGGTQFWVFAGSAILLAAATLLGGLNYVSILEMGTSWLNLNVLAMEKTGTGGGPAWQSEKARFDRLRNRLSWAYNALIWSFAVGAIGLASSIALSAVGGDSPPRDYVAVPAPAEQLILVDPSSGESWRLVINAEGGSTWKRVAPAIRTVPADN